MDMIGKNPICNLSEPTDEKPVIAVIDDEDKWLKVYKRMFRNSNYCLDTYSDRIICFKR